MKNVYLKAAKIQHKLGNSNCGSCNSIVDALQESKSYNDANEVRIFSDFFKPENLIYKDKNYTYWFGPTNKEENNQRRILALLFMHEIVNSK